jgi:hypothetical protein
VGVEIGRAHVGEWGAEGGGGGGGGVRETVAVAAAFIKKALRPRTKYLNNVS